MSLRGALAATKQSPFRRVTFLDSGIPFNGRLLRREEHPPRNDMQIGALQEGVGVAAEYFR